ncbi:MAG: Gx transporter family protein [Firmicutes bacterium]|nr:Gx transporter family protein [Bacillota bacterium]
MGRVRRRVLVALLVAAAAGLHAAEGLLPPLPLPGARIGLANVATLLALRILGFGSGVAVSVLRSLLGGLIGGGFMGPGFWMGFAGATLSAAAMGLTIRLLPAQASNVAVSVIGATVHSLAQLGVAAILIRHPALLAYLPVLLGASMLTGVFIGLVCDRLSPVLARVMPLWRSPDGN